MTKTIYTHKTKGTKLTLVERLNDKSTLVLNENNEEITLANITLTRWYDMSEEVVTEIVTEVEAKRNGAKMISFEEVVEASSKAISTIVDGVMTDIFTYSYGKSLRAEAIVHSAGDVYRLGSVLNPTNGKVVSSYYLVNDSKDGLSSIQRKGVKAAAEVLSTLTALSLEQVSAVINKSRQIAQEEIQ